MRLHLIAHDLKQGDVVLSRGNYRDKTVALTEYPSEKDTLITWSCGGKTRYNSLTELDVWRSDKS